MVAGRGRRSRETHRIAARRGTIRRGAMFRKLRGVISNPARPIWKFGWASPAAANVAGVHNDGLEDRPGLKAKAKPMRYPRRVLLGLTNAERGRMLDLLLENLHPESGK